jgi:3-oxoadipate enol-lactonase
MENIENSYSLIAGNVKLSYTDDEKYGAPVIIFIHGFPFNKSMWNSQIKALNYYCRVISYDIRGFGNSESGNEEFTIDLFAKDLICLMDTLKIEKSFLCGLSMGGYIALNAVKNYPDRFNALILSDTSCKSDTPEAKIKRRNSIDNIRKNGVGDYADETIKNLFAVESFTEKKEEIAMAREMIMQTSEASLCSTLLALSNRKETCRSLNSIKVPVLIIAGNEDKVTPPSLAQYMHEKIKDSSLKIIEHAGHLSNLEKAEEFNYQLERFVDSVNYKMNSSGK